ncbi:MAG: phytoene desaturase [Ideonella sp. WA131b]|jgi:1-hydroxycarotenoid 3,4-desaturase|nr:phytoene desaturase [Ideonella sp. WA131b]
MPEPRVVVVGAGIGGLVSALLLATRGLDVTLLEAADGPGGKMHPVRVDGALLDAGPTVFTMRWVFDELLADVGSSVAEALPPLTPLPVLARHAWARDGSRLDLFADRARSAEAIAAFAGPEDGRAYLAFCERAARVYGQLERPHIRSGKPGVLQMIRDLGPRGLATLAALGPLASLASALQREFRDERLRQLFGRYATYCGASPWGAPATLMLVAHVEQEGVWAVQGGMAALADSLARLALARGARLRYGARVQAIEHTQGQVSGVRLADGETLASDAVVFNGDASALAPMLQGLPGLAPRPAPPRARTLSAVTWAMRVRTTGFGLARHNVFFDRDYASEFDDVFRARRLPRRATVYLCAQDRLDGGPLPMVDGAPERLLMLVNAPPDGDCRSFDDPETDACQARSLDLLRRCGLTLQIDHPHQVLRRTPVDFHRLFPATGGALYGPSTHGWMALFRRAAAATALPGLYLAGGSVHPGPGVPMAAMSGRLAAATLMARLGSTQRSSRVRIAGGTSMRSATTAATP